MHLQEVVLGNDRHRPGLNYICSLALAPSFHEKMLGLDFYVFLLVMILAIVLLFVMVWHVSGFQLGVL